MLMLHVMSQCVVTFFFLATTHILMSHAFDYLTLYMYILYILCFGFYLEYVFSVPNGFATSNAFFKPGIVLE